MVLSSDDAVIQGFAESQVNEAHSHDHKLAAQESPLDEKKAFDSVDVVDVQNQHAADYPTEEEQLSLTRVPGEVPIAAYLVAFVELAER